jgi:hypothetical protein
LKHRVSHLQPLWSLHSGKGPVFATAVHAGHEIRRDLADIIALQEDARLREEDPYTDLLLRKNIYRKRKTVIPAYFY